MPRDTLFSCTTCIQSESEQRLWKSLVGVSCLQERKPCLDLIHSGKRVVLLILLSFVIVHSRCKQSVCESTQFGLLPMPSCGSLQHCPGPGRIGDTEMTLLLLWSFPIFFFLVIFKIQLLNCKAISSHFGAYNIRYHFSQAGLLSIKLEALFFIVFKIFIQ